MLCLFAKQVTQRYDNTAATFNGHQLTHLAKSVKMLGPLWGTSTFPFKNGNGKLLKPVSASNGVPLQISERCVMADTLKSLRQAIPLSPFMGKCCAPIEGKKVFHASVCVLGAPKFPLNLTSNMEILFCKELRTVTRLTRYLRAHVRNAVVHSLQYQRPEKTRSQYVEVAYGNFCQVHRTYHRMDEHAPQVFFVCKRLITSCAELGMVTYVVRFECPPVDDFRLYSDDEITGQCIGIDQANGRFITLIPNVSETD